MSGLLYLILAVRAADDPRPFGLWTVRPDGTRSAAGIQQRGAEGNDVLGTTSMRILKHAMAVMRPRGGVFDLDVDEDVLRSIVGFLEYLPAPTRLSFPLGLRLLEYGPFLFREGFRTFSSMDEETAARYLHHWERAGSAPSLLYQGVRALVFVCFYQHPRILEAMEVDWQGRAEGRVRFRARVMRDQILRSAEEAGARAEAAAHAEAGGQRVAEEDVTETVARAGGTS